MTYGSLEQVKFAVHVETDNQNAEIEGYLQDADGFINDKYSALGGTAPIQQPSPRVKALSEQYAIARYWERNNPDHPTRNLEGVKSEIVLHIRSLFTSTTDDGMTHGRFGKTDGSVSSGHGI